jgi:hypothetical protein
MRALRLLCVFAIVAAASLGRSVVSVHATNALPYYYLPWDSGVGITVSQGNNGPVSHFCPGTDCYAWDFPGNGLNVRAARGGTVTKLQDGWPVGTCNPLEWPYTNYVKIDSGDGYESVYLHLASGLSVSLNQVVPTKTQVIGLMGASGYTCNGDGSGPGFHLHYQVEPSCPTTMECYSVPSSFLDPSVRSGGVPLQGDWVIPGNTPPVTPCSSASASASPSSPSLSGTQVTVTGNSTGCPNPFYEFWVLWQGYSTWQLLQGYSTSNIYHWNSTGTAAGTETFAVWAIDLSSVGTGYNPGMGRYDAYTNPSLSYIVTVIPCTSVTASAAPPSPSAAGTPVTITGSASGCPNPRYEFWYLGQGSSTWQLVQGYSTTTTYNWNSLGALAGTHIFSVWARDASSTGLHSGLGSTYDAYSNPNVTYTITTPTLCASVTALVSPGSPRVVGTIVTISASASGCSNPRYEFWDLAPGGTWTIVQAYSSSATFIWNTTGLSAGTYYYSVWARDVTSSAAYDTFFPGTAYVLT